MIEVDKIEIVDERTVYLSDLKQGAFFTYKQILHQKASCVNDKQGLACTKFCTGEHTFLSFSEKVVHVRLEKITLTKV